MILTDDQLRAIAEKAAVLMRAHRDELQQAGAIGIEDTLARSVEEVAAHHGLTRGQRKRLLTLMRKPSGKL
jgi:hypothetical protein